MPVNASLTGILRHGIYPNVTKFGMPTYIWSLHVPTKLQVHSMYISREMEFGPPPIAPPPPLGMGMSKLKLKKCRNPLNSLQNTNLDSILHKKNFTFIWAKSEKWSFLTITFGCRNVLPFVNRGFILSTVRHRSVIYDPTDICTHSLKRL